MSKRIAIVCFPGSNCEHDVAAAWKALGGSADIVWHTATTLKDADAVVLPGGFAHGDYLRPGAIARFSPIMREVARFADDGGPVVGICNGFQVLTEAGLLPGALCRNSGLRFLCKTVECEVASTSSILTSRARRGQVLSLPINHYEGRFTCDESTLDELEGEDRVVLRYRADNPNGSVHSIAGITNRARNVVGLMPHPERASDALCGSVDGRILLESLLASLADGHLSEDGWPIGADVVRTAVTAAAQDLRLQ
jgi:phosphoribosylformylglycinamidine synthase